MERAPAGPNLRRIYLAGPDVFLPQVNEIAERKKALCRDYGFEGLFPLDNSIDTTGLSAHDTARAIYGANVELMGACDIIIANCTPFRGVGTDPGTAYEVGRCSALGKIVCGYINVSGEVPADHAARARLYYRLAGNRLLDPYTQVLAIEDFDRPENLMLTEAAAASGGLLTTAIVASGHEMTDLSGFVRCLDHCRINLATGS